MILSSSDSSQTTREPVQLHAYDKHDQQLSKRSMLLLLNVTILIATVFAIVWYGYKYQSGIYRRFDANIFYHIHQSIHTQDENPNSPKSLSQALPFVQTFNKDNIIINTTTMSQQSKIKSTSQQKTNVSNDNNTRVTSNSSNTLKILIVSRRRTGSSWLLESLVEIYRQSNFYNTKNIATMQNKNDILSLFEPLHRTAIVDYRPYVRLKESYYNYFDISKTKSKKNNKVQFQQQDFSGWINSISLEKFKLQAGMIDALFNCNFTLNFDNQIGMHFKKMCGNNGLGHYKYCTLSNMQNKCLMSKMIILKSTWIDYRSLKYLSKDLLYSLKFIIVIRNPFDVIESQLDAKFYKGITDGIDENCDEYYSFTIENFIQNKCNLTRFFLKYETLKHNFQQTIINITQFIYGQDIINNINEHVDIENYNSLMLRLNAAIREYESKHSLSQSNCSQRENKQTYGTVRCQETRNASQTKKYAQIAKQSDFVDKASFVKCFPEMKHFGYRFPPFFQD